MKGQTQATDTTAETLELVFETLDRLAERSGKSRGELVGEAMLCLVAKYAPEAIAPPEPAPKPAPRQQINIRAKSETKAQIDALAKRLNTTATSVIEQAIQSLAAGLPAKGRLTCSLPERFDAGSSPAPSTNRVAGADVRLSATAATAAQGALAKRLTSPAWETSVNTGSVGMPSAQLACSLGAGVVALMVASGVGRRVHHEYAAYEDCDCK